MAKVNNLKANAVEKLVRSQAEQGIVAAVLGNTMRRVAMGVSIQRNLKVLARMRDRERDEAKRK